MSTQDIVRTLIGSVAAPSATGALVFWWTQDVVFASFMAFIPLGWEIVRLYVEREATWRKRLYALLAQFGGRSSAHWRRRAAALPTVYSQANADRILAPRLQEALANGGTMVTVAGDGYPIHAREGGCVDLLQNLLNNKCVVHQYASAPTDEAHAAFTNLANKWPDTFHYRHLAAPHLAQNEDDRFLLETLATLHPTYAIGGNGEKLLWVEQFHGAKTAEASGCELYEQGDLDINAAPLNQFQGLVDRAWGATQQAAGTHA